MENKLELHLITNSDGKTCLEVKAGNINGLEFLAQYVAGDEIEMLMQTVEKCIARMSPAEKAEYGIPEGA